MAIQLYLSCKNWKEGLKSQLVSIFSGMATSVLLKHNVRAKFVHLMTREDTDYVLVQMKIHRSDRQKFLDAMEDLKTKMLICGHADYEARAGEFIRELEDDIIEQSLQDEKLMKKMGLDDKNIVIVDG